MQKHIKSAGRPASKLIFVLTLAAFSLALLAGIRLFGGGDAVAAISDSSDEAQVSTETDAQTSDAVLSPSDIAEMEGDYAMSACVNYADAAEAIAAEDGGRSVFSGNFFSVGSYAKKALLAALDESDPEETDTTTQNWFYYIYYVGQDDSCDVTKTDDFSLKYQMEFRTSEDLDAGAVEIRIPAVLLTYRDGETEILPDDIAVPAGDPINGFTYSSKTPMNYYYETDENGVIWLVFWNYREITSGTDMAWQVLYRNLKALYIVDMTDWTLDSYVSVDVYRSGSYYEQTNTGTTLSGLVDTSTKISTLTKTGYSISGKSYTPCLYTSKQVNSYISYQTSEYDDVIDHFDDYVYVVWKVIMSGSGNQAFTLETLDVTESEDGVSGKVIGYSAVSSTSGMSFLMSETGVSEEGYVVVTKDTELKSWSTSYYIVTAYPADEVTEGTELTNTITAKLTPADGLDEAQTKTASATVTYKDYDWEYPGDMYSVSKESDQTYAAYAESYKYYYENGLDFGNFPFTTTTYAKGYSLTHTAVWPGGGAYLDGTYYTVNTEDSIMYLNGAALTYEDYYFSSVTVSRTDHGYDIYEDETITACEEAFGVDQTVTVYAMFADNPGEWEIAGMFSYGEDGGTVDYSFVADQIAREPYAVKAVYNTVNYDTTCKISVNTVLRNESEVMHDLAYGSSEDEIILTDESTGTITYNNETQYERTRMAEKTFTRLSGTNKAEKTVTTTNDATNARVQLTYSMAAYDGYSVYDSVTVKALKYLNVVSPSRNTVVFYDLLPYGVHYDASVTPTAGRITSLKSSSEDFITSKSNWSTAQVEITEVEIMENWEGTGRTMVAFHLSYSGADSSVVSGDYAKGTLWYSGWGVSFKAYYDWKDIDVAAADANDNIFAYMPESDAAAGTEEYEDDMRALLGKAYADDGSIGDSDSDYADLSVSDLNGDGDTATKNVLYGKSSQSVNVALASTDYIEKLVRADDNVSAPYAETASVAWGKGYTYDITVTTINGLTDLVIFDRLEYGLEDHTPEEEEFFAGETDSWTGTFVSIDTTGLELAGADDITIWYNEASDARIPGEGETASDILTVENGWYTTDDWAAMGLDEADVGAFAVDLGDFELAMSASITFQIHMTAPAAGETDPDVTYAFNNAWFSSYSVYTKTYGTVQGDTVRVSLGEAYELTVEKVFDGDVPSDYEDTEFEFSLTLTEQNQAFSQRIYTLWEKDESGGWQKVSGTYATDYNGYLYLQEGQKAVFEDVTSAEIEELRVLETESAFWSSELASTVDDSGYTTKVTYTVTNTFRTPLYVTKLTTAVPTDVDISDYEFELAISIYDETSGEWEPYADSLYWVVKAARTNGTEPTKIKEGRTESDGTVRIHAGEVIAVFLDAEGTQYKVEETDTGADFIVQKDANSGEAALNGTAVNINNIYRWKDLNLKKFITYQDASECTEEFTFQILHVLEDETTEALTTENEWYMTDGDGNVTDSGTLTADGKFTAACAGCTVTIRGLDASETYLIQETESGELYEDVTGSVSVTMPLYSTSKSAEYTNKWLMRDLSVSKYVAGDTAGASDGVKFTFSLYVDGEAAEGDAYQITENGTTGSTVYYTGTGGSFTLENGQTAVFSDCGMLGDDFEVYETDAAGFTRVYPSDESALTGTFEEDGSQVTFVNGDSGSLMVAKSYTSDNSTAAAAYVSLIQSDEETRESAAVTFTMKVTTDGETYTSWPTSSVTVEVIDTLFGTSSTATWTTNGITIEPWMYIVITSDQLGSATGYRISESAEDQHQILQDEEGNYLSITQSYPADNAAYTGDIDTSPVVTTINKVSDVTPYGSAIYKRMAVGSDEPSTGAELALTVQQYNGSSWVAAEGVAYLTFDEEGLTCDRVLYTDSDGSIVLTKTENGYPYIQFLNAEVSLNFYDTSSVVSGACRIIENAGETETEEWGLLVGYGTAESAYGYSLDETEAAAFVNANRTAELKVEKVTDVSSSQSFTFTLSHVISTDEDGNILADEAGAYLSYLVYDAETDELVSNGTTDALGQFTLTGGQYAVFELADGATWTVSETTNVKWTLSDLTAETDETITGWIADVILDNTAEVRTLSETAYAITAETSCDDGVDADTTLDKDAFTVTAYASDGTSWTLASDDFEISPEKAQSKSGEMEVTVSYQGAEDTILLTVIAEEWNVSYAVAIYGIQVDTYIDEDGDKQYAGLTFGPATGENYVSTFRSHVDTDADGVHDNEDGLTVVTSDTFVARTAAEAKADGVTYCIHELTWTQIVEQGKVDPTVFEDCLEYGCTHSVHINLNTTLLNSTKDYSEMTGDGASVLYNSIVKNYRTWNATSTTNGGWSSSKIRTTLNSDTYGLITCFPSALRNNIVSREICSTTAYASSLDTSCLTTTSDPLWLLSYKEIWGYSDLTGLTLTYEGTQYARMTKYATSSTLRSAYTESGNSAGSAWLRSMRSSQNAYYINTGGRASADAADVTSYGIAPGFCLPGPTVEGGIEEYNVSYAVAIYGIHADTYLDEYNDEQTAGLTFGPATGASYISSYRSHVDTEADGIDDDDLAALSGKTLITSDNFEALTKAEAEAAGCVYCIHWLTWEQIIEQCAADPEVFEDCLAYGCTHSVHLNLNYTLWTGYDYSRSMTGDGASILYNTIKNTWRTWNYADTNSGGWPASRIRATLNGAEDGVTTATAAVAGTDVLSADVSLFSCFPDVLQQSIVAKAVQSNTVYNSSDSSDVKTTYDKLWLLSFREFFNTNEMNLKYEGTQYSRMTKYARTLALRIHYHETGSASDAWLRSPYTGGSTYVWYVYSSGGNNRINRADYTSCLAPGFCLP